MNGPLPEGHFMQVEQGKLDNYEITIKVEEQGKRGRWKAIKCENTKQETWNL